MKRYYFHIRTAVQLDRDTIGTECHCDEDAIAEAHQAAREIVAEWVLEQHVIDGEAFEIIDERGELVAMLRFKDVLRLQ
jgi:hypothetical protein